MNYNPLQYGIAQSNIVGSTLGSVKNAVVKAAGSIDKIVKQKDAQEKLNAAYKLTIQKFVEQAKEINPDISNPTAILMARKAYREPTTAVDLKTNYQNLIASDITAQKILEKFEQETRDKKYQKQATSFAQKTNQPIEHTRQVKAEGPPIQQGERAGEFPMEEQTIQRPMRTSEYEQQYSQLPQQAREYVPEGTKERVSTVEQVFQQPLKTFEEQRDKMIKESDKRINTMGGLDKAAGIETAKIESNNAVEELNTKKKTVDELIKTVGKSNNLSPRQVESQGQKLDVEIEELAADLNIPLQLSNNTEFLGRMKAAIDRLIDKESKFQNKMDMVLKDMKEREKMEARRKSSPPPRSGTDPWRLGKELQDALDQMSKALFPKLNKVMDGAYGIEVMKQASGLEEAARKITSDPRKRIALAYAYPDEVGSIAKAKGAVKPSDREIQAVMEEVRDIQNRVSGVVKNATTQTDDLFSGLGDL